MGERPCCEESEHGHLQNCPTHAAPFVGETPALVCGVCGESGLPLCCTGCDYDDGSHDDAECVACCTRTHLHTHPAWWSARGNEDMADYWRARVLAEGTVGK